MGPPAVFCYLVRCLGTHFVTVQGSWGQITAWAYFQVLLFGAVSRYAFCYSAQCRQLHLSPCVLARAAYVCVPWGQLRHTCAARACTCGCTCTLHVPALVAAHVLCTCLHLWLHMYSARACTCSCTCTLHVPALVAAHVLCTCLHLWLHMYSARASTQGLKCNHLHRARQWSP